MPQEFFLSVGALREAAYKNLASQFFFFYNNCCTWFVKIIEEKRIGFHSRLAQSLLDSHSSSNHIQPPSQTHRSSYLSKTARSDFSIQPTDDFVRRIVRYLPSLRSGS